MDRIDWNGLIKSCPIKMARFFCLWNLTISEIHLDFQIFSLLVFEFAAMWLPLRSFPAFSFVYIGSHHHTASFWSRIWFDTSTGNKPSSSPTTFDSNFLWTTATIKSNRFICFMIVLFFVYIRNDWCFTKMLIRLCGKKHFSLWFWMLNFRNVHVYSYL